MQPLIVDSTQDAFAALCKRGQELKADSSVVGMVVEFDGRGPVRREDGVQCLALRIANHDGGIEVPFCTTINAGVAPLKVGDLVLYYCRYWDPEQPSGLLSFNPMGFVTQKLDPVMTAAGMEIPIGSHAREFHGWTPPARQYSALADTRISALVQLLMILSVIATAAALAWLLAG